MVMERLITARDVAEMLGFAPGTIVDWAEAGKLPAYKIGGRLRFRLSEIEAFVQEKRRGPSVPSEDLRAV